MCGREMTHKCPATFFIKERVHKYLRFGSPFVMKCMFYDVTKSISGINFKNVFDFFFFLELCYFSNIICYGCLTVIVNIVSELFLNKKTSISLCPNYLSVGL